MDEGDEDGLGVGSHLTDEHLVLLLYNKCNYPAAAGPPPATQEHPTIPTVDVSSSEPWNLVASFPKNFFPSSHGGSRFYCYSRPIGRSAVARNWVWEPKGKPKQIIVRDFDSNIIVLGKKTEFSFFIYVEEREAALEDTAASGRRSCKKRRPYVSKKRVRTGWWMDEYVLDYGRFRPVRALCRIKTRDTAWPCLSLEIDPSSLPLAVSDKVSAVLGAEYGGGDSSGGEARGPAADEAVEDVSRTEKAAAAAAAVDEAPRVALGIDLNDAPPSSDEEGGGR